MTRVEQAVPNGTVDRPGWVTGKFSRAFERLQVVTKTAPVEASGMSACKVNRSLHT